MDKNQKKLIENEANNEVIPRLILSIKTRPLFKAEGKGLCLNEGYEFEVNGALPEIADGIAKLAKELPKQGFGKGTDSYFIQLINQYFNKL